MSELYPPAVTYPVPLSTGVLTPTPYHSPGYPPLVALWPLIPHCPHAYYSATPLYACSYPSGETS